MQFESVEQFDEYMRDYAAIKVPMASLSGDSVQYYYFTKTNDLIYFDYEHHCGGVDSYQVAKEKFAAKGINLRHVLADFWGGIRYARENYLENAANILAFDESKPDFFRKLEAALGEPNFAVGNGLIAEDSAFLARMNARFNSMSEQELVDIELAVVFLFCDYAERKHGNRRIFTESHNQFKEKIYRIEIQIKNKLRPFDLSNYIFTVLYPDIDRDDIEDEEIDVMRIKRLIDYYNSDRVLKVEPN